MKKQWYANADQIAYFLGEINPYWSSQEWKKMLYEHLELTKKEVASLLSRNYAESINIFDTIEKQALMMADMMREGMKSQFPKYL